MISLRNLYSTTVGSCIGWGAFILPTSFLLDVGIINTIIGFFFSTILVSIINYSYVKLKSDNYNNRVSVLCLFVPYTLAIPLNALTIPLIIEKLFYGFDKGYEIKTVFSTTIHINEFVVVLFAISIFFLLNLKEKSKSHAIQDQLTLVIIVIVLILSLISINYYISYNNRSLLTNIKDVNIESILKIVAFAPWAYSGFEGVSKIAKNLPNKPVYITTTLALLSSSCIYVVLTVITAIGVDYSLIIKNEWTLGNSVLTIVGYYGVLFVGFAMLASIIGGLNGFFITASTLVSEVLSVKRKYASLVILSISIVCTLLGRDSILLLVEISSLSITISYIVVSYSFWKKSVTIIDNIVSIISLMISTSFSLIVINSLLH